MFIILKNFVEGIEHNIRTVVFKPSKMLFLNKQKVN